MIVGIGSGTFMLREAATAVTLVIGGQNPDAVKGPSITAYLNTPGGIVIAPNGDIYFTDSNNNVIDRVDRRMVVTTVVGNRSSGFSGDNGPATRAQLDTPDGVAIAPDGDLIVAEMAAREQRVQELETELQRIRVERLRDQEKVDRLRHDLGDRNNRLERALTKTQELAAIIQGGHLQ